MAARQPATRANCGSSRAGQFCERCGQDGRDLDRPLRPLVLDLFDSTLGVDARIWRTLALLFRDPGRLALDFAGRRTRYVPLRLFLFATVFTFFVTSMLDRRIIEVEISAPEAAEAIPSEAGREMDALERFFRERIAAPFAERPEELRARLERHLPQAMYAMVPVFAALLHLLYRRTRRPLYIQHLIFSLHFHALNFLVITAGTGVAFALGGPGSSSALGSVASGFFNPIGMLYLSLGLRRLYGGGLFRTIAKQLVLAAAYLILSAAAVLTVLVGAAAL
jgi:hypothetical protein